MTSCPLAAGEEWGQRWDFNRLVENHDIDYNRCTLPNVGGVTEFTKVMALCETHAVGMVPHFTGPIATAALVNCLATYPARCLRVQLWDAQDRLPSEYVDFKQGKVYVNERPGLGVTVDLKPLKPLSEVTQPVQRPSTSAPTARLRTGKRQPRSRARNAASLFARLERISARTAASSCLTSRSTGVFSWKCDRTISGTSRASTPVYQTPSGYTTMFGPHSHKPSDPQVVTCTSSSRPRASISRRSASKVSSPPRAQQLGAPSGFF